MPHTKEESEDKKKKKEEKEERKRDKKEHKEEKKRKEKAEKREEKRLKKKSRIFGPREKVLKLNKDGKWQLAIAELRLDGKAGIDDDASTLTTSTSTTSIAAAAAATTTTTTSTASLTSSTTAADGHSLSLVVPVLALYDYADVTKVIKKIPVRSIRESTYTGSRFTQGVGLATQSPGASQTSLNKSSSSSTFITVQLDASPQKKKLKTPTSAQGQAKLQGQMSPGSAPTLPAAAAAAAAHNSSVYYAVMSTKNKEYIFSLDYNRDIILANYDDSDAAKKSELRKELSAINKNFFAPLFERVSFLNTRPKKSMSRLRLSTHYDPMSPSMSASINTNAATTPGGGVGGTTSAGGFQLSPTHPSPTLGPSHALTATTGGGGGGGGASLGSSSSAIATANIAAIPPDDDEDEDDEGDGFKNIRSAKKSRSGIAAVGGSSPTVRSQKQNYSQPQLPQFTLSQSPGAEEAGEEGGAGISGASGALGQRSASMASLPVLVAGDLEKWHAEHGEESIERSVVERGDPKKVAKKKMKSARKARARVSKPPTQLQFKVNVQGEVVYKGHPSWLLMHQMQIGIRYCIGKEYITQQNTQLLTQPRYWERPEFFRTPLIYRFPEIGAPDMATHTMGDFKFKDYCPLAFRYIRAFFGVDRIDFISSLCHSNDFGENALRLMTTPGKSGSLFFFSQDMRYIIKTIPKREAALLRSILPPYIEHITKNPETLLPRFYGLYRVKPHHGNQVRFVITNNLFATPMKVHERFDLKGSFLGRFVTPEEQAAKGGKATLKEKNWVLMKKKVHVGPTMAKKLLGQIKADVSMLKDLGIMDYSLLIGIHYENVNEANLPFDLLKSASSSSIPSQQQQQQQQGPGEMTSTPMKTTKKRSHHQNNDGSNGEEKHHKHHKGEGEEEVGKKRKKEKKEVDVGDVDNDNNDDGSTLEEVREIGVHNDDGNDNSKKVKKSKKAKKETPRKHKKSIDKKKSQEEEVEEDNGINELKTRKEEEEEEASRIEAAEAMPVPQYAAQPEVDMDPGVDPEMPEFLMSIDMQPQAGSVQVMETEEDGEISIVSLPYSDEFAVTGYESMLPKATGEAPWYVCNGGMQARDENDEPMKIYYFVGIIDILMFYTPRKVAERIYKKIRYYGQGEVSSCPPPDYAKRFYEFMERYIE